MEQLDFSKLLQQVDSGYRSWRKPSLLLFGANDPFVDVKNPFAFLDDKRTNMRLVTASAKVGGMQVLCERLVCEDSWALLGLEGCSCSVGKALLPKQQQLYPIWDHRN